MTYSTVYSPENVSIVYKSLHRHMRAEQDVQLKTAVPLAVTREDGDATAVGIIYDGWLEISLLHVDKDHRRQGYGAKILHEIERKAIEHGAHSAYAWTHDFEAPEFYTGQGYTEFARLKEFGKGHDMIAFRKYLLGE